MKALHGISWAVCMAGFWLPAQEEREPLATAQLFERWRGNLVLVSAGRGRGSGFVCELDGQSYIVTCAHVLQTGDAPSFHLLTGTELAWSKVEFAEDADLVRLRLREPWEGGKHTVRTEAPRMEEQVVVIGNNQGFGVATAKAGKVVGIGVGVLEVTAEVDPGISGAPILDGDGKVLGVASHGSMPSPASMLLQGPSAGERRRFGLLLAGRKWTDAVWDEYAAQARLLSGLDFVVRHELGMLIFHTRDRQLRGKRAMKMESPSLKTGPAVTGISGLMKSVADLMATERNLRNVQERMASHGQNETRVQEWRTLTMERDATLKRCLSEVGDMLSNTKWATPLCKRSAELAGRFDTLSREAEKAVAFDAAQCATFPAGAESTADTPARSPGPAGSAPVLIAPAPGALLPQMERQWVFEWGAVEGATHYELLVTNPSVPRPFLNPIVDTTRYTRNPPPRRGGYLSVTKGWIWRVRARGQDGAWGPWSAERSFEVEPRRLD